MGVHERILYLKAERNRRGDNDTFHDSSIIWHMELDCTMNLRL